jgi:hypothetical protein
MYNKTVKSVTIVIANFPIVGLDEDLSLLIPKPIIGHSPIYLLWGYKRMDLNREYKNSLQNLVYNHGQKCLCERD